MMNLADFRRLCVEYGEARVRYQRHDTTIEYRAEWKATCDKLWTQIVEQEKLLTGSERPPPTPMPRG